MHQAKTFEAKGFTDENYLKVVKYLDKTLEFGIKPELTRIQELATELSNPQLKYPSILVTGTNGKTSVSRMISTILAAHGYKTGLYTSPHLNNYCERFSINSKNIEPSELSDVFMEIEPKIKKVNEKLKDNLTNFEILTALAFYCFAKNQVDCAVFEVGMGGRFDATSIVDPKVSVITNVELDHISILGKTRKSIAKEKSYIIKNDSKAVLGELKEDAKDAITERLQKTKNDYYRLGVDFFLTARERVFSGSQKLDIEGLFAHYRNIEIKSLGKHQAQNACLAVVASELFNERLLMIEKFKKHLSNLKYPGRLDVVCKNPTIIIDGAHNQSAAANLAVSLREDFDYNNLILVLAVFKDKDYKAIIQELVPLAKKVIFSENSSERTARAFDLVDEGLAKDYKVVENLEEAIVLAKKSAQENDLILITGSLTTAADGLKNFKIGSN